MNNANNNTAACRKLQKTHTHINTHKHTNSTENIHTKIVQCKMLQVDLNRLYHSLKWKNNTNNNAAAYAKSCTEKQNKQKNM